MRVGSISFMPAMVRAERAGLKTQTRRVVKEGIHHCTQCYCVFEASRVACPLCGLLIPCPYGAPGGLLYVKEAAWMWCERVPNGTTPTGRAKYRYEPLRSAPIHYVADHPERPALDVVSPDTGNQWGWRYKVARFLPRWASRTTLEITDVRVERLQEISEEDARAEGISPMPHHPGRWISEHDQGISFPTAVAAFRDLWESINGPDSWFRNDRVWAVTFKSHRQQVDDFIHARASA
ncbi:MAG TPA: hypothetical protein VFX91_00625 [Alcanivorax sp.]|nr:hypothetical protein [Alcanivorax sp.]